MARTQLTVLCIVLVSMLACSFAVGQAREMRVESDNVYDAFLVDGEGRSLYFFLNDRDGESFCTGRCLETWTPFLSSEDPVTGDGVDVSLVGAIDRGDGNRQVTYAGRPLYTYGTGPDAFGTEAHGSGALWFLISPVGDKADETPSEPAPREAEASLGTGIYTLDQAQRGRAAYNAHCAVCHMEDLMGEQYAPTLRGDSFLNRWSSRTVGEFYQYVHDNMPFGQGGILTDQQYADIVAYVFEVNEFPPGNDELSVDRTALDAFTIDAVGEKGGE